MSARFTLRQLEYFAAIADAGSLSAAASTSHVSPTALALSLDELERQLALQLVIRRKGKGITLTAAGANLLLHARHVLAGAEEFAAEAAQNATGLVGSLTVGCFSPLSPFVLPRIMDEFPALHPGIRLEIAEATAPDLQELLLQGRLDAALLYSVDVRPQLAFEAISSHPPHVIVGQGHRLAGRARVGLAELATDPLIQLDVQPTRQNTEHIFASLGLQPAITHTTTNYELARCLVGRGLGYAIQFQRPASLTTYDGHAVVAIELSDQVRPSVVGLVRAEGAPPTAKYTALRDFLRAA